MNSISGSVLDVDTRSNFNTRQWSWSPDLKEVERQPLKGKESTSSLKSSLRTKPSVSNIGNRSPPSRQGFREGEEKVSSLRNYFAEEDVARFSETTRKILFGKGNQKV